MNLSTRLLGLVIVAASCTSCSEIGKKYDQFWRYSAKLDAAQAKKNRKKPLTQAEKEAIYDKDIKENGDWAGLTQPASARFARTPEEKASMEAEEAQEKVELTAYNRRLAQTADDAEPAVRDSAPLEIENIDRDDSGWGTITYTSGATVGTAIGGRDYPWFAYSPTLIVVHSGRTMCKVMDPAMHTITDGNTHGQGDFVALRVVGNNIVIETEDERMLHTQTYDKHLSLLRDASRYKSNL